MRIWGCAGGKQQNVGIERSAWGCTGYIGVRMGTRGCPGLHGVCVCVCVCVRVYLRDVQGYVLFAGAHRRIEAIIMLVGDRMGL